ncbi:hypothetical protein BDP27DRAFT_1365726 [Rhodocollybia butyracea]|uniref:Uncharacterized protein n=1 Tax=Rhodocollybia butyracea TaxID=206335 RepID=A0A9P5PQK2_9AGAR|nr:hypothetical protein BDP27DRAFT_1365726 [Rhodocollybia butyracea]
MRFPFAAAAALLGCLLSTGICAAKPISARRDLSIISEEITARSITGLSLVRRYKHRKLPRVEFQPKEGAQEMAPRTITKAKKCIEKFVKKAQDEKVINKGDLPYFKGRGMKAKVNTRGMGPGGKDWHVVWFVYIFRDDKLQEKEWTGYVPADDEEDHMLLARLLDETGKVVFPKLDETGKAASPKLDGTGKAASPKLDETGKAVFPKLDETDKAALRKLTEGEKVALDVMASQLSHRTGTGDK